MNDISMIHKFSCCNLFTDTERSLIDQYISNDPMIDIKDIFAVQNMFKRFYDKEFLYFIEDAVKNQVKLNNVDRYHNQLYTFVKAEAVETFGFENVGNVFFLSEAVCIPLLKMQNKLYRLTDEVLWTEYSFVIKDTEYCIPTASATIFLSNPNDAACKYANNFARVKDWYRYKIGGIEYDRHPIPHNRFESYWSVEDSLPKFLSSVPANIRNVFLYDTDILMLFKEME